MEDQDGMLAKLAQILRGGPQGGLQSMAGQDYRSYLSQTLRDGGQPLSEQEWVAMQRGGGQVPPQMPPQGPAGY